jgi:hemerythrin-like domain-containing protein
MLMNENKATFDHPLQLLHACHGKIMQQCSTLRSLTAHVQQHGCDQQAQQAAQAILRYFETAGELHHQDEELELFPALRAVLTAETAEHMEVLMARVLREHAALAALWGELEPMLRQLAEGQQATLSAELTEKFISGYFAHITLEEKELLPLSEYLLKPDRLAVMGASMAARRHVKTGGLSK